MRGVFAALRILAYVGLRISLYVGTAKRERGSGGKAQTELRIERRGAALKPAGG